jgi:hypothetical protein
MRILPPLPCEPQPLPHQLYLRTAIPIPCEVQPLPHHNNSCASISPLRGATTSSKKCTTDCQGKSSQSSTQCFLHVKYNHLLAKAMHVLPLLRATFAPSVILQESTATQVLKAVPTAHVPPWVNSTAGQLLPRGAEGSAPAGTYTSSRFRSAVPYLQASQLCFCQI